MQQKYNMINANCFSYSVTTLNLAIEKLLTQPILDSAAVSRIFTVIEEQALFSGVRNNTSVSERIMSLCTSIQNRLNTSFNHSEPDKKLAQQAYDLIMKLDINNYIDPPTFGH